MCLGTFTQELEYSSTPVLQYSSTFCSLYGSLTLLASQLQGENNKHDLMRDFRRL